MSEETEKKIRGKSWELALADEERYPMSKLRETRASYKRTWESNLSDHNWPAAEKAKKLLDMVDAEIERRKSTTP